MKKLLYVGLDVHKETITVAVAPHGEIEVRFIGTISNNSLAVDSLIRKLASGGDIVHFAYEAGPGGYTLYRQLREKGYECMVVAPSLIPRRSGERVKTDRRDALMLARLYRAGELTGIYVPDKDDEAIRDLFRLRCVAKRAEKQARQNLLSFLLRNGFVYSATWHWTKTHWRWLHELRKH